MNRAQIEFTPSDVWLLYTIIFATALKGAELRDIIAAGDYINHAVFSFEELRGGLLRLSKAGYIEKQRSRYILTKPFAARYDEVIRDGRSYKIFKKIERILVSPMIWKESSSRSIFLRKSSYEKALRNYLNNF